MARLCITLLKHITLYLLGLLFCDCAWSLGPDLTLQQMNHTRWTVAEGAPNEVFAIAQTADATLWVGGGTGLSRFDGIRFIHYPESADEPLPSANINALTASPDGGLWIGFLFGGVSFLKDGHVTSYGAREGVPSGSVQNLAWDHDGTLWVAALGGLARLHHGHWERIAAESIPTARGALVDRAGTLWVATEDRVFARPAHEDRFREMAQRSAPWTFMPLAMSPDGTLWMWSRGGLTRLDSPTALRPDDHRTLGVSGESPLLFDRDGNLWMGGEAINRLPLSEQLSNPTQPRVENFAAGPIVGVDSYFEDREGSVWVGSEIGLDRFSHSKIVRFPLPPCTWRYAITAGDAGTLWAACRNSPSTVGFVLEIRNGVIVHRQDTANFTAGFLDPDGTVWLGGDAGLGHIESGHVVVTPWPEEVHTDVQAVVRDRTGAIWVYIVSKGLFRFSDGRWSANGGLEALPHSPVIAEAVDADGTVWLGYMDKRIARVHGDQVELFDAGRGLNVGTVTAIQVSGKHVWVGGQLGFARFDGTRFIPILGESGTSFTGVSGIIETRGGDLWLNGHAGITHIPRPEVEHVIHDATHRVQAETLDYLDGVPGTAQQLRPDPSAVETTDGRLWFQMTGGLVLVDPARIARNPLPPPVTIWSISSKGVRYPVTAAMADLQLPVHTTHLQIAYTAGSLTVPERVRFRYQLEDSDHDWQDVGNRHEAVYTNLGPGRYTFRVIAANSDGVWNNTGASVHFTILPAFNQTKLFYALCAVLCLAALYALYKVRTEQVAAQVRGRLEARLAERERIARELHDTLLQGVQGLMLRFQAVAGRISQRDPARALMEQALERADQVLGEGRDRVKDLRTTAEDEVDLPLALAAEGEQLALMHPAQFQTSVVGARRVLHPIVHEEVMLTAREALGNAFRHAKAQHIEAEISYDDTVLHVRIRDDGGGIDTAVLDAGGRPGHFGLLGMRERAGKIRAQLKIWSKPGAGTEIDLQVPAEVAYRRTRTVPRPVAALRWSVVSHLAVLFRRGKQP